jgi:hypothetical protein
MPHDREDAAGKEALLLVHFSSLDSYVWECGEEAGSKLRDAWQEAIAEHPGPLVITDPGHALIGRESRPRASVLEWVRRHRQVTWFAHNEETEGWDEPMRRLGELLRSLGITHVRIGGVWATEYGRHGCVNETLKYLAAQGFVCWMDADICGFEPAE